MCLCGEDGGGHVHHFIEFVNGNKILLNSCLWSELFVNRSICEQGLTERSVLVFSELMSLGKRDETWWRGEGSGANCSQRRVRHGEGPSMIHPEH